MLRKLQISLSLWLGASIFGATLVLVCIHMFSNFCLHQKHRLGQGEAAHQGRKDKLLR